MIRIRYSSELRPGLNGHAERLGRVTVVYLLPGLSQAERAATLRRLRQHGRMGIGPQLPGWQLTRALLADRVRTTFGQAGAIVRVHPAGSTVPVMVMSAAVAGFLVLSAVSIRIVHAPLAEGGGAVGSGPLPTASASGEIPGARDRGQGGAGQPGPGGSPAPHGTGTGSDPRATPRPGPSTGAATPAATSSGPPSVLTTTAATAPPASPPASATPTAPVLSASGTPESGSPAAVTQGGSTTKICVSLGPFGVCLGL